MRVIVRRCEGVTSHLLSPSCLPVSNTRFHQLHPVAGSTRRFARWITTKGSLAGSKPAAIESPRVRRQEFHSDPARTATLKQEFHSILAAAQPDLVMEAFLNPDYHEIVAQLPQGVFVEAFRLLSPSYFIEPYKELHELLSPRVARTKRCTAIQVIYDEFATNLSTIIRMRQLAGHPTSLAEYTHLLDCAQSIGDGLMAEYIWHSMSKASVSPDLTCYNHYMESKIWNGCHAGLEQYRMRMTSWAYYRRRDASNEGWNNYGTGPRSLKREIRLICERMLEVGLEPDERTMINVFLAVSRTGWTPGMWKFLYDVWNVDVRELENGDRKPIVPIHPSSPVYPTSRLLWAVTHAFGTSNDIPGALRVLDQVSNSYGIEIPESVWIELLKRSYILSVRRHGRIGRTLRFGTVSYGFIRSIYETITKGPFKTKPTFDMHWFFAKSAWNMGNLQNLKTHMMLAYEMLEETRRKRKHAREVVESYLPPLESSDARINPDILRSRGFAEAVRAYDIIRLRCVQQTTIIERLARLCHRPRHHKTENPWYWARVVAPRILEEWRDFLPEYFTYETPAGTVKIRGNTLFGRHSRLASHDKVQVRRPIEAIAPTPGSDTVDDDFIWAKYRDRMSTEEQNHSLLKLLIQPVRLSDDIHPSEMELEEEYEQMELSQEVIFEDESEVKPTYREPCDDEEFKNLVSKAELEARERKEIWFEHAFGYINRPELAYE
ncbi:mitochondrial ATPase expression-domain-containing protein [Aspergillus pseudodeflectus]|uniref:Mitochondrial ATPase expression-domain-containing protein n=1 Tax=Aspergillus pseudodeflectus TaxID=176178 RepID=A0ABR4K9Y5_9EURO